MSIRKSPNREGEVVILDGVRHRLLGSDDVPATSPYHLSYRFGQQDTKPDIVAGKRQPDGVLAFDLSLKVKEGKDP